MEEFTFRSDDIDVERIMERIRAIRARIQEKRGVDYTQEQLRELASLQLERFQESKKVRSVTYRSTTIGSVRSRATNFSLPPNSPSTTR